MDIVSETQMDDSIWVYFGIGIKFVVNSVSIAIDRLLLNSRYRNTRQLVTVTWYLT